MQEFPLLHLLLQPPQFLLSVIRFTHFPLQQISWCLHFFPAKPTVLFISLNIDTFLLATVWTWATFRST
ncbi:hypothetical protein HanPSC8_Chr15g0651711 [Helianthus annuus]|nr:hypothetical protein HanPSC8_Chr15g0651711 [Helianthus annuus]